MGQMRRIVDDERDYGNPEKAVGLRGKWENLGYNVISMRDDWKIINGEGVIKTGEFHWLEDYADDMISYWKDISSEQSNTVFFERPGDEIMKKYYLAPDYDDRFGGDLAHVVVMQSVDHEVIDSLIADMQEQHVLNLTA